MNTVFSLILLMLCPPPDLVFGNCVSAALMHLCKCLAPSIKTREHFITAVRWPYFASNLNVTIHRGIAWCTLAYHSIQIKEVTRKGRSRIGPWCTKMIDFCWKAKVKWNLGLAVVCDEYKKGSYAGKCGWVFLLVGTCLLFWYH